MKSSEMLGVGAQNAAGRRHDRRKSDHTVQRSDRLG